MQISILGCGWLGLPLAQSFINKGYELKGSVTTAYKLKVLQDHTIIPYNIVLKETGSEGDITGFLNNSDVLIIDIPPKLRNAESENFTEKINKLVPYIEASGIKKVLFVSSISVYGERNKGIVTEDAIPYPDTESGRQLLKTEHLLIKNTSFKTTVIRFAGLIGGERHPVYHLAGRENLSNAFAPVNLIHRDDCIGIIEAVITKNIWAETFNAAMPYHPSKKEYYTLKAIEFGLQPPQFAGNEGGEGKIITAEKVMEKLDYGFGKQL